MTAWAKEQIEMRLGYSRRLVRRLRTIRPAIRKMGVTWAPWMQQVMLYYYYPEKLSSAKPWIKQLAEILVACEQFEAYSNRRRGRDYYVRKKETLIDAFAYLEKLQEEGFVSDVVVATLRRLTAQGEFDTILEEARGRIFTQEEKRALRAMEA
jgi:hypothetical protein